MTMRTSLTWIEKGCEESHRRRETKGSDGRLPKDNTSDNDREQLAKIPLDIYHDIAWLAAVYCRRAQLSSAGGSERP